MRNQLTFNNSADDFSGSARRKLGTSVKLYESIGGAAGCRALAAAFYARVEQDPILRPLFPSTFRCAIEAFSAFLVQFLGGESEATQHRWWLSLRESHRRFAIGPREQTAWLRVMSATLKDASVIADADVRQELLQFFAHSSAYLVNQGKPPVPEPIAGEALSVWEEQLAIDEAVALLRDSSDRCLTLLEGSVLQRRFKRSPSVHASILSLAAKSNVTSLREYVINQLRANPSLIHERYSHERTLLHDAASRGNAPLVETLLDLGAGGITGVDRVLYCVGNENSGPSAAPIIRLLVQRAPVNVNATHGVKGCTALHMAARRGNLDAINALLDAGADIECRDRSGDTPLRRASNCRKHAAAKLLLSRGANGVFQ